MYTITNILQDVDSGIAANNMIENYFTYRIIYFINDGNKGTKFCIDTPYDGLRAALENIIRKNLSTTNTVVIAQTTVLKNRESICLQSRSYSFNLDRYFQQICDEKIEIINNNNRRRKVQWGY